MYLKYGKRIFDLILSVMAVLILSPILMITAVIVRVKLGKPVIFSQARPGRNEKIFQLYKFRSMTDQRDPAGELMPDEIRLTRFGKRLRATSLDELPELFNILRGDMSIVGPRPLLTEYLERYNTEQRHRHDVRPGLTGLAQVKGRNALSWEEKFRYDMEYVRKITLVSDIKIIALTVRLILARAGINSENAATMEPFMGTGTNKKD